VRRRRSADEGMLLERLRIVSRTPLSDEAFRSIVNATGLPMPASAKRLRGRLERLRTVWRVYNALPPLHPGRTARRMRRVGSAAAGLLDALDQRDIVELESEVEAQRAEQGARDSGEQSGFELVRLDIAAVQRIQHLAQARARSLDATASALGTSRIGLGRSMETMRRDVVLGLVDAFERAYRRRAGVSRDGPGVRFVRAFFAVHGRRVSQETARRWLREARR
jgi:hypothetical protein